MFNIGCGVLRYYTSICHTLRLMIRGAVVSPKNPRQPHYRIWPIDFLPPHGPSSFYSLNVSSCSSFDFYILQYIYYIYLVFCAEFPARFAEAQQPCQTQSSTISHIAATTRCGGAGYSSLRTEPRGHGSEFPLSTAPGFLLNSPCARTS